MLELGASSGGKRFMDMMPQRRPKPLEKHAIVGQNGVAAVLDRERRIAKGNQRI